MAKFLSLLCLRANDHKDDGEWVVAQPFGYQSDLVKEPIVVPEGFRTDLASVPRVPIAYWLAGGTSNEAAVIHDYLYSTQMVPRDVADAILSEASKVIGVPAWRRGIMWAAVRVFGGSHWETKAAA